MNRSPAHAGYASAGYAAALAGLGIPLALPHCGGWLLRRPIAAGGEDACGAYPLFSCCDWTGLEADIEALPVGLVSVGMVIDPFADLATDQLGRLFPDRCIPYKTHYVRELARTTPFASHHRRNVRASAARMEVEACIRPAEHLDDWSRLYGALVARHGIRGAAAFSRESFARQLALPDLRAYRAVREGRTVGMALWLLGPDVVYYHLAAYDEAGYRNYASFALFDRAIADFRAAGFRWLAFGGAAGAETAAGDGLARFKQGWSTGTRTAWFGGRILDAASYRRLSGDASTEFFPAYRAPNG